MSPSEMKSLSGLVDSSADESLRTSVRSASKSELPIEESEVGISKSFRSKVVERDAS